MADKITLPKDYNIIQLATGDLIYKGQLAIGEPFYSVTDNNLYIGGLPNSSKYRIGGHNGLHYKGILSLTSYDELEKQTKDIRQPGDGWLLHKNIARTPFVSGQLIIWTGNVLINQYKKSDPNYKKSYNIPNAYKGWVSVAGGTGNGDAKFVNDNIPTAANPRPGQGGDWDYSSEITDMKTALEVLFNTRCNYIGPVTLKEIQESAQIGNAFDFIRSGEWCIYVGEAVELEVNDKTVYLQPGDEIWCQNEEYNIISVNSLAVTISEREGNSLVKDDDGSLYCNVSVQDEDFDNTPIDFSYITAYKFGEK